MIFGMLVFDSRRIAYQESSHTFAVIAMRVDAPSKDKPGTLSPIRPRYIQQWGIESHKLL